MTQAPALCSHARCFFLSSRRSGVSYVAQPGGSIRDDQVIETCDKFGMVMAFTGMRLFHH